MLSFYLLDHPQIDQYSLYPKEGKGANGQNNKISSA